MEQGSIGLTQADVTLNGSVVLSAADLQRAGGAVARVVDLGAENTLQVTISGSEDAGVVISLLQVPDPTFTVYGPRRVERSAGAPPIVVERFTISATAAAPYTLFVQNGGAAGNRSSSARVRINGAEVVGPADLNQNVAGLERTISLRPENTVEVEVAGAPGAFVTVHVTATDVTAPVLALTSPAAGLVTRLAELEVAGTVQDETATRVTVNGAEAERSGDGFRATVQLAAEGNNVLSVGAVDAAGNRTDSVRTVVRDTEAPVLVVTAPADGLVTRDSVVLVTGTVHDRTSVTLNVNGVPAIRAEDGSFAVAVPLAEGANFVSITATDAAGNTSTVARAVTRDTQPPAITIAEPGEGVETEAEKISVRGTVADATPVALTINGAAAPVGSDGGFTGEVALVEGTNTVTISAADAAGNSASATRTVTRRAQGDALPPDPETVAPPLERSVATTMGAATSFLYTGTSPIQTGVAPGVIQPVRASVVRGRVLSRDGAPLPGVSVTIKDHTEFGQTLSRVDGAFDMAVNGGGLLTVEYARAGYLSIQRQVHAHGQEYAHVEDAALVQLDPHVSQVTLTSGSTDAQVARGSVSEDADGARRPTLIFAPGTEAEMVLPDGSTRPLSTLSIRTTEVTVGPNGATAMPGPLPPSVAYTYALDISVDEARAAGAEHVRFTKPVAFYVDNFLEFPAGTAAPVASYDFDKAAWIAEHDGVVLTVLAVEEGLATLDTDGDGQADGEATLAALGIGAAERARLAAVYSAGASLWRVQLPHFSWWDINWIRRWFEDFFDEDGDPGPPEGGGDEREPDPEDPKTADEEKQDKPICEDGSIIECENQVLGETIGLTGTPFTLTYRSDRAPGYGAGRTIIVPVTGATIPESVIDIRVRIEVAGQVHSQVLAPQPNQRYAFVWNGKDGYGRPVQGRHAVKVTIGYVYPVYYRIYGLRCQSGEATINRSWDNAPRPLKRCENTGTFRRMDGGTAIRSVTRMIDVDAPGAAEVWDNRALGWGGWTLDVNHSYDPVGKVLRLGDGRRQTTQGINNSIQHVAGMGTWCTSTQPCGDGGPATEAYVGAQTLLQAPDGSLYIADRSHHRIRRITRDGIITTVAGTGQGGVSGDGGPALQARFLEPMSIAMGPDGSLYVGDFNYRVRRIDPRGIVTTIAGTGTRGYSGDGGPATAAQLSLPTSLSVGPDNSVYVADYINHRVRRIGPDGVITTVAGTGVRGFSGDGQYATGANLNYPWSIALDNGGNLYISDAANSRIRRVSSDGIITTVAGNGVVCDSFQLGCGGDGGAATEASVTYPEGISLGRDGSLYIAEAWNDRVRRVGTDGIITTVAGGGPCYPDADPTCGMGGAATAAYVRSPLNAAVGSNGELYIAEGFRPRIRRVATPLPGYTEKDIAIPSEDGAEVFYFNSAGRHLRTVDALTGARRYDFEYDEGGRLVRVADRDGRVTAIGRDQAGNVLAVVSPDGDRTSLTIGVDGYLASATNPAGEAVRLAYSSDGLLVGLHDPKNNEHRYSYDGMGWLIRDEDPTGAAKTLSRTTRESGSDVTFTTEMGYRTVHRTETTGNGELRRSRTDPSGLTTLTTVRLDGTTTVQAPDGTVMTAQMGPDPQFGLQASLLRKLTIASPGGLVSTLNGGRRIVLADPDDPFSITMLVDSSIINGRVSSRTYEAATRRFTNRSTMGRIAVEQMDSLGRVTERQGGGLSPVRYRYDIYGRLIQRSQASRAITYEYDDRGRLAGATDPLRRSVRYGYDDAGRLVRQVLPDGRQILYGYDANGNLSSITPPDRPAHTFEYLSTDLPSAYVAPGAGNSGLHYRYNRDGNLVEVIRPDGQTISMGYDQGGRLDAVSTPEARVDHVYNPISGVLSSITSGSNALRFAYDGSLLLSTEWRGEISGTVGWGYDQNFWTTFQTINGANRVDFSFDRDGMLVRSGALVLARSADRGALTGSILGEVAQSIGYNGYGEQITDTVRAAGQLIFARAYDHDPRGRISSVTETVLGTTSTYAYGYDDVGRLVQVTRNGSPAESYEYDGNGNRTLGVTPNGVAVGVVDAQDRLLNYGDAAYSYSAGGELESVAVGSDTTRYRYDVLGNLRVVTLPGAGVIEYVIDPQNRRVGKKVNGTLVQGFLYQNQLSPVAELDGSGNVVSRFVYGDRATVPAYMTREGVNYRFVADHLGSVRLVVNAGTGQVLQRLDYDSWGNVILDSNPGFQPFGFAGGLYDAQTKLTRFGARDYDARTGRWTAKDPILFAGRSSNLYAYGLEDPVNRVDPDGLQPAVPPPPNIPGGPWTWSYNRHNSRGGVFRNAAGQEVGWDATDSHWDFDDGTGNRTRYDRWGNNIPDSEAHAYKGPRQEPIDHDKLARRRGGGGGGKMARGLGALDLLMMVLNAYCAEQRAKQHGTNPWYEMLVDMGWYPAPVYY